MKKMISAVFVAVLFLSFSVFPAAAQQTDYDLSPVYDSLSDEVIRQLDELGVNSADAAQLSEISFESIISQIVSAASQNSSGPLKGLVSVIALLLICSMLTAYSGSLSGDISQALSAAASLCVSCSVALPAVGVINLVADAAQSASGLMLAYIPVIAVLMAASGSFTGSGTYYAAAVAACETVSGLCSGVVTPFMGAYLGLCVTSSVSPHINLSGFSSLIAKTAKWMLGLSMTVFTTVLSARQLLSGAVDGASSKAVKFALSSFVPVVGSALSEAYKTVQGGVTVLKSGLGVFVIVALCVIFLPALCQSALWMLSMWVGKAAAQSLNLSGCAELLGSFSEVFSILFAVLLCMLTACVVLSAVAFVIGGGAQ